VPVCRHENHLPVAEHIVLAVHQLVFQREIEIDGARAVADLGAGQYLACRLHLRALDEEGRMGEELVATGSGRSESAS